MPHTVACFFFFNDTAPPEIYTLSLHDALPIPPELARAVAAQRDRLDLDLVSRAYRVSAQAHRGQKRESGDDYVRSEEHTSELQSRLHLVCRLLLEKKNKQLTSLAAS